MITFLIALIFIVSLPALAISLYILNCASKLIHKYLGKYSRDTELQIKAEMVEVVLKGRLFLAEANAKGIVDDIYPYMMRVFLLEQNKKRRGKE